MYRRLTSPTPRVWKRAGMTYDPLWALRRRRATCSSRLVRTPSARPGRTPTVWRRVARDVRARPDLASTCARSSTRAPTSWSWSATSLSSVCEHHLLLHGRAHVGCYPRGGVDGLRPSWPAGRAAARRPQVQERPDRPGRRRDRFIPTPRASSSHGRRACRGGISCRAPDRDPRAARHHERRRDPRRDDGPNRPGADDGCSPLARRPASSPVPPPALPGDLSLPVGRTATGGHPQRHPRFFLGRGRYTDVARSRCATRARRCRRRRPHRCGRGVDRPNSTRISAGEERARICTIVVPGADGVIVKPVDTLHASTAREAAARGCGDYQRCERRALESRDECGGRAAGCAYVVRHYRALPGMPGSTSTTGRLGTSSSAGSQVQDAGLMLV